MENFNRPPATETYEQTQDDPFDFSNVMPQPREDVVWEQMDFGPGPSTIPAEGNPFGVPDAPQYVSQNLAEANPFGAPDAPWFNQQPAANMYEQNSDTGETLGRPSVMRMLGGQALGMFNRLGSSAPSATTVETGRVATSAEQDSSKERRTKLSNAGRKLARFAFRKVFDPGGHII